MAALFFGASLTPSLYPRPWFTQAILSGAVLAAGYGLGSGIAAVWQRLVRRTPPPALSAAVRPAVAVLAAGFSLWMLVVNYRWQVDVRELMGVPTAVASYPFAVTPVALLAACLFVVLGRAARAAHRRYRQLIAHVTPRRGRVPAHLVIAGLFAVLLVDVVVGGWAFSAINDALVEADARYDADVSRPDSRYRAGGSGSLIAWETLGSRGRAFVTQGPRAEDITAFSGKPASQPIRVYAGLTSAPSHRERAELAVADLERVGAFDRDVLLLITPTGTGSVNRYAVDPLEYMFDGNTAAVALQYSYLPSWLVMAGNQDRAKAGARALFEAVTQRLQQEPVATRPRLLLYGESLGSFGSAALFAGLDDLLTGIDGALWVGPPRASRLWQELTFHRDAGSPVWKPVYRRGTHVRFGWDTDTLSHPRSPWEFPRIVYLQHASDPITWLTPRHLFERPEWLEDARGPDISQATPYVPVVTFVQAAVDMALGANAPVEHGHIFGPAQAEAWALVAAPRGWTAAGTERLLTLLHE